MSIDFHWKHIIVRFYNERNKKCTSLNTPIFYVAYRIYKYKMYWRLEQLKETDTGIQNHIKESLYGYSKVVKRLNTLIDYKLFNRIAQLYWLNITISTVHIMSYISCWKTHYQYLTYLYTFLYIDPLRSKKTVLLQINLPEGKKTLWGQCAPFGF